MMKISKQQIAAMGDQAHTVFARDLARYLRAEHGDAVRGLDGAELFRRVQIGIARAEGYGMTWSSTITAFVAIMFEVAPTFDEQPAIRRVLGDGRIAPDVRIDALWKYTSPEDWEEAALLSATADAFWTR